MTDIDTNDCHDEVNGVWLATTGTPLPVLKFHSTCNTTG